MIYSSCGVYFLSRENANFGIKSKLATASLTGGIVGVRQNRQEKFGEKCAKSNEKVDQNEHISCEKL